MELYAKTGVSKLNAIKEHIAHLLESTPKFLVFAHHLEVLNAIESLLLFQVTKFLC